MRLLRTGVKPGLNCAPRLRLAIVVDEPAGRGRVEQCGLHVRARNPAACHHGADAKRFFVENVVATSNSGASQLLGATIERGLCVGALTRRRGGAILAGSAVIIRTAGFAVRFNFLPAMCAHDVGCGSDKCGGGVGGYRRQILAPKLGARLAAMPAVGLMRFRVNAVDNAHLAIAQNFNL